MVAETVSILIESIDNQTTTARRIEIDGPLMVRGSARISEK
jgi:DNA-binding LacI/PurR family transcriptional regulator